jgi:hypothetical protein
LKKRLWTDNFLSHLDIYGDNEILWTLPEKNGWNSHEFEELEGRTSAELEDSVLYQDFDDGNLISKFGTATFVKSMLVLLMFCKCYIWRYWAILKALDWRRANKWPSTKLLRIQSRFVTVFRGRTANTRTCKCRTRTD